MGNSGNQVSQMVGMAARKFDHFNDWHLPYVFGSAFLPRCHLGLVDGGFITLAVVYFRQPVIEWLKKINLGQQIFAAFLASLFIILISFVPFAWLKLSHWQARQTWAVYARDAISMSGAFTTAGTIFGLLSGLAWFEKNGGFDPGGFLWKRITRFLIGAVGVLFLYLGLKVLFGLIVPDSEALIPLLVRYIRYFLVGARISAAAPWVFVHLNMAEKAR